MHIADIREGRGDVELSISELRAALEVTPDNQDLHLLIADDSLKLEKLDDAIKYYSLCVKYSERAEATDSGYYLYSLISLGEIYSQKKDKATAKKYFNLVKKHAGRKDEAYKDAKQRLKKLEKDSKD